MVAVPAATPVTTPAAVTVAIAVLLDDQVPPLTASAMVVVWAVQAVVEPVIVAGATATVTLEVALVSVPEVRQVPVPVQVSVQ